MEGGTGGRLPPAGGGMSLTGRQMYQPPKTSFGAGGRGGRGGSGPSDYVAGRGRGASGFITQSELGPIGAAGGGGGRGNDAGAKFGQAPPGYVAGRGRGLGDTRREALEAQASAARAAQRSQREDFDEEGGGGGNDDDRPFDENEGGLFADAVYEEDDREADQIYQSVDERMDARGARKRTERLESELKKYRNENPSISQQFADVKRDLSAIDEDAWAAIPEIGDYSVKKQKLEKYTPAPDSLLEMAQKESVVVAQDASGSGANTDLASIGEGRGAVLGQKLDRVSDSVSGQTVVDPKGYLTQMNGLRVTSESDVSDIKKSRLLLTSVTSTNPKHAPGWIAAARLEEFAGRMQAARKIIAQGCKNCPKSEEVWLEAVRLHPADQAKAVLAGAVKQIPTSVAIWLQASALEETNAEKRLVLRKALEIVPQSAKLWKAAVDLEKPEDARIMLKRAVECVPDSVDLWLALARLEPYESARKVLNQALNTLNMEPAVWITGAKLQEVHGGEGEDGASKVSDVVARAVKALSEKAQVVDRDGWLREAKEAEDAGFPVTCRAVVKHSVGLGLEEIDQRNIWKADAEAAEADGHVETARAILSALTAKFPARKGIWMRAARFEKKHGTREALSLLLQSAVKYCPQAEALWLMAARELWQADDIDGARNILSRAFEANPKSEAIWLAAVKLEMEDNQVSSARQLLANARTQAASGRVYMKSALLERRVQNRLEELRFLQEGIEKFPRDRKLWLMLGQWHHRAEDYASERSTYQRALAKDGSSPDDVPIWLALAQVESESGSVMKARAVLERARQRIPKNDRLWLASVRLERDAASGTVHANTSTAGQVLAKGLQQCPSSGRLWAEAIEMEPRPRQKVRSADALKRCDKDARVMIAVARFLWRDRKIEKTRAWFGRAVALDADLGDAWAYQWAFEHAHGTKERVEQVEKACLQADPRHGELWIAVSKAVGNEHLKTLDILRKVGGTIVP